MDAKGRESLKEDISRELDSLSSQLSALEEGIKPVPPDDALGRLTRLDAIQGQAMNQNTYRQAKGRMIALQGALARIDDPGFGLCVECGEPIPMGRLKLMPETQHCVNCA